MATPDSITVTQLSRLIVAPDAPLVLDVRTDDNFAADPSMLPASPRHSYQTVSSWAVAQAGQPVAVVCQRGRKLEQGTAAWLRHAGGHAEFLEAGFEAWAAANALLIPTNKVPPRDSRGRTVWLTHTRPKIDRIAGPWLIRRFVDPAAAAAHA